MRPDWVGRGGVFGPELGLGRAVGPGRALRKPSRPAQAGRRTVAFVHSDRASKQAKQPQAGSAHLANSPAHLRERIDSFEFGVSLIRRSPRDEETAAPGSAPSVPFEIDPN